MLIFTRQNNYCSLKTFGKLAYCAWVFRKCSNRFTHPELRELLKRDGLFSFGRRCRISSTIFSDCALVDNFTDAKYNFEFKKWAIVVSNHRPQSYQDCALTH